MIQIAKHASGEQYANVKSEIDRRFPRGRFVAVEAGRVLAEAKSHKEVVEKLLSQGRSPKDILILEAGADYPTSGVITVATTIASGCGLDNARACEDFKSGPWLP